MAERPGESLRLFVAIELPAEVRQALLRVQDDLRRAGADRLRWVRPEGVHLTLKFLGEVAAERVDAVEAALRSAIEPFELRLRLATLGGFGGARLRVVWVGLEGDVEPLAALAEQIERALTPLGFPRERRPFAAHLTLARVPDATPRDERERLASLLRRTSRPPMPSMVAKEVSLMRSVLGQGGAVYTRLTAFPA